ncbi:MAG: energy-coupling factor ABC transporter permease, partial [Desulfatirhabdiaceae bacterium]
MHITEGIIVGKDAVLYTAAGISLIAWGVSRVNRFVRKSPENKPFLGMGAAIVFFLSLIPIPAFTGTCSHPCGTPLIGILLGPSIGIVLTGISLLLQAAFFAHGGFSTWGANVVALGLFGCFFGWGVFRIMRRLGLPLWAAGVTGGLVGDVMVYVSSGLILGTTLVQAPNPQYSLSGYLLVIYSAYLPTQLPIALGEALITGMALHYAGSQRPEILASLGVLSQKQVRSSSLLLIICVALFSWVPGNAALTEAAGPAAVNSPKARPAPDNGPGFSGMDEVVNDALAEKAGRPSREPYLNTEAMGDLWNLLLLSAGGICGFILGRCWHLLWGRPEGHAGCPQTGIR